MEFLFSPIGVVRSPLSERAQAARQPSAARDVEGRVELFPGRGFDHALEGLDAWEYVWILFVFHRNVEQGRGFKPKVLPPRATQKKGVFGTRSPHRPNPIGMSAMRIERVEGLVVHVRGVDVLDGTPVIDLKPYVPYADAYPDARHGWLEVSDPRPSFQVAFSEDAMARLAWLSHRGVELRAPIETALALGPEPHPYRRIRRHGAGLRLALKEWRVDFDAEGDRIIVRTIVSGYRPREIATSPELELHRKFVATWSS